MITNTEDLEVIKDAKICAEKKDGKQLKKVINRFSQPTLDLIVATSSLVTIADFIRSFL
jgi:hypothetical protein